MEKCKLMNSSSEVLQVMKNCPPKPKKHKTSTEMLGPKKFEVQKDLGLKKLWVQKTLCLNQIGVQKILSKTILG